MITYLLQLTISWAVLFAAYYFILRQETHFKHSRWYLLTAICLGIVIPLVDWAEYFTHQPESLGHLYITPLNVQMAQWDITVTGESQTVNWYQILNVVYIAGALIAAARLIHGWTKIYSIRQDSQILDHDSYSLVLTDQYHLPFSFMGSVYCSKEFYRDSPEIDQILAHEEYHINAMHSLDVVFLEILKVLFWFHPLVYIYKKEIQQIHEYQADFAAYQLSSRRHYGRLLLTHAESAVSLSLVNHFFNSQLKNRFKMMTRKTSNQKTVWKYIVMLPMVAMTILLFSYSSQGKALIDKVMVTQDTILPPPPPVQPPPPPPALKEVVVVGYQSPESVTQDVPPPPQPSPPVIERVVEGQKIPEKKEIFKVVEQMPRYPGCDQIEGDAATIKKCADRKMLEFIYTHVRYPAKARQNGVEGAVVVSFVVEKDGSITNPKVIRNPGAGLGEEALRIVGMMADGEKWTPGKQRGQNVRVQFIIPIRFELNKEHEEGLKIRMHNDEKEEALDEKPQPIFVLNDKIIGRVKMVQLNKMVQSDDIESINILKGQTAIDKYGEIAQDGAVEIYTKWQEEDVRAVLHMNEVRLYPVPADNQLNITAKVENSGHYRLQIRDLKGQIVKRHQTNVTDGVINTSMDLDGLAAGPYYLTVSHEGKVFSKVFVKQ